MENQHREIKGYRELNEAEIAAMNEVKMKGAELGVLVEKLRANKDLDQRWISIGATDLQTGLMALTRAIAKPTFFVFALLLLAGCITPFKEPSGRYVKTAQSEMRSMFGTNQSFARLERCDGPEKKVMWFTESDFSNCVMMTKAEQDEWMHASSRGAGPEIIGAAIVGGSIGAGAALSGGSAAASAGVSASNTAIQSVNVGKHHRR